MRKIRRRVMAAMPLALVFVVMSISSAFAGGPPTLPGNPPLL